MLKKIKAWWEKINTPYYKRSLESLQADEKKDKSSDHTSFIIVIIFYALPFLMLYGYINLITAVFRINVTEIETLILVPALLLGFLAILIYICFVSLWLSNIYTAGNIMTNLKHITIQLKIMEKDQTKTIVFKKKEGEKENVEPDIRNNKN